MRIVDDTGRLWRAPEVKFEAGEIGLEAFGYNIENRHLVEALDRRARSFPNLRMVDDEVLRVAPERARRHCRSQERREFAGAAGGRRRRAALALPRRRRHRYRGARVSANRAHAVPDTFAPASRHFHRIPYASGPFTLVPLPGQRSSLVWVRDPADADDLAALDDAELSDAIERASHSILGKIAVEPGRGRFPLTRANARRFAANRIVLVGEAAHVIPPIGAQGLNLGLRDASCIGELAAAARRGGRDIGGIDVLAAYDKMRRADIGSRTFAVDLLNRTLLSDFLPVQGARGLGLYLLDRIGPLRRALMREGVAPRSCPPRQMHRDAL